MKHQNRICFSFVGFQGQFHMSHLSKLLLYINMIKQTLPSHSNKFSKLSQHFRPPLLSYKASMAASCTPAFLFKLSILLLFVVSGVFAAGATNETAVVPIGEASNSTTHDYARKDVPVSSPSHQTHSVSLSSRHLLRTSMVGRKRRIRGLRSKLGHGHHGH